MLLANTEQDLLQQVNLLRTINKAQNAFLNKFYLIVDEREHYVKYCLVKSLGTLVKRSNNLPEMNHSSIAYWIGDIFYEDPAEEIHKPMFRQYELKMNKDKASYFFESQVKIRTNKSFLFLMGSLLTNIKKVLKWTKHNNCFYKIFKSFLIHNIMNTNNHITKFFEQNKT